MNFFKKLFGKNANSLDKDATKNKPVIVQDGSQVKDKPASKSIHPRVNDVPSVEPIVRRAVEYFFKTSDVQEQALKIIQNYNRNRDSANTKTTLALIKYSNGDLALFEKSVWQSHPHFWMDEISPIFRTLEEAKAWAQSLGES